MRNTNAQINNIIYNVNNDYIKTSRHWTCDLFGQFIYYLNIEMHKKVTFEGYYNLACSQITFQRVYIGLGHFYVYHFAFLKTTW